MPAARLLLFEPAVGGHRAEYLRWVAEGWRARSMGGRLTLAVAEALLEDDPRLHELAYTEPAGGVDIVTIPHAERLQAPTVTLLDQVRDTGRMLADTVGTWRPERVLVMYLDHSQLALARGLRFPFPVRISGILFKPTLHYGALGHAPGSFRERLQHLRKRLFLRAVARNAHLDTIFSLDPTAVPALQAVAPRKRVRFLPDPVPIGEVSAGRDEVRRAYGVEPGRRLALLFGSIEERKGVFVLFDALRRLPEAEAGTLAVVVAGRSYPDVRARLHAEAEALGRASPVQLVVRETFLSDAEAQNLVAASDLVLAPYQRHVGSSGVLMRAAAAGVPVLAQDYGLVGQQVRQHALGRAVDTTDPGALARALTDVLRDPAGGFDHGRARAFAEGHTTDRFVDVLFGTLLDEAAAPRPRLHPAR